MKKQRLSLKRKIVSLILIISLSIITPTYTYAQVVADPGNLVVNTGGFIEQALTAVVNVWEKAQPYLDLVAYAVAQQMAQKLVTKITNSINGSASGDEAKEFIKDFGSYFEKVAFEEGQKYVTDIASSTKNPFSSDIGSSLVSSFSSGNTSALDNFSLGTVLGVEGDMNSAELQNKLQEFGNDATVGGYSGLFALGMPENTPIGSRIIAQEELANKIAKASENAKTELTSTGFAPKKGCTGTLQTAFTDISESGGENIDIEEIATDCEIKNPAGLIGDGATAALGNTFDRLAGVSKVGQLVSSVLTQIAGALITKGISSLGSSDMASSSTNIQYGGASDVRAAEQASSGNLPSVIIDFSTELAPAITQTQAEIAALEETITLLKSPKAIQLPHDLDTCTPGPDKGWETRFDKYFTKQTKGVVNRASEEGNTDEQEAMEWLGPRYSRSIDEARGVVGDLRLNIPGVAETKTILDGFSQKASKFQETLSRLVEKKSSLNSLLTILSRIKSDPEFSTLILTDEDWAKLDNNSNAKIALYAASTAPGAFPDSTPPRWVQGVTPVVIPGSENDINMKENVFVYQWDKWEKASETTEARKDTKRDLFLKFNQIRGDVSSETAVARAQTLRDSLEEDLASVESALGKCLLSRRIFGILPFVPPQSPFFQQTAPGYTGTEQQTFVPTDPSGGITPIRVSDLATAKNLAIGLRNANLSNTSAADIEMWNEQLANLFPELKGVVKSILAQESILKNELTSYTLTNMDKNLYGDDLQVHGAKTIGEILQQDSVGKLFCKLPERFRATNNGGDGYKEEFDVSDAARARSIVCATFSIGNVQYDPVASGYISTYRNEALKDDHSWYFSSGFDDYVIFDSSSSAGQAATF